MVPLENPLLFIPGPQDPGHSTGCPGEPSDHHGAWWDSLPVADKAGVEGTQDPLSQFLM